MDGPSRRYSGRRRLFRRPYSLAAFLLLAALIAVRLWQTFEQASPPEALVEGTYQVERVVDGDTLLLANEARVRLIGVDCPESAIPDRPVEPFGRQASEFTKRFVYQNDGIVRLQYDRERVDRYGRFLAYVWVGDDMLNESLIREGLARALTGFPYSESMKTRFRNAESDAKAAARGIWSQERH
jgi:micrococcal nuclease